MTDRPLVPIFDLDDHFDTTIEIGDKMLPVHIKRFSRTEMEAFEKKWNAYFSGPRGTAELTPDERDKRDADKLAFCEEAIRDGITIDEGLVRSRGRSVTNGAGLLEVFHARKDVLSEFLLAIYTQNKLTGIIRKNSSSPRGSDTSSEPNPARGGDEQGSIATPVESSGTATSADATASSASTDGDAPASSGAILDSEKRSIH